MRTGLIIAAVVALGGCQQQAAPLVDTAAASAEIGKVEQDQIAAISAKDAVGSVAPYSDDAVMMGDNGETITGREAISAMFKQLVADPNLKIDYRPGAKVVSSDGTMAYSIAAYTESYTDSETGKAKTVEGSNLSVWRKQADGSWKLVADSNPASPKI